MRLMCQHENDFAVPLPGVACQKLQFPLPLQIAHEGQVDPFFPIFPE